MAHSKNKKAEKILEQYPNSPKGSEILAMCYNEKALKYMKEKQYDLAVLEYQNILEEPVNDEIKTYAILSMGRVYERKGDTSKAMEKYQFVIDDNKNFYQVKYAEERVENLK